jgi:hypothetical protein
LLPGPAIARYKKNGELKADMYDELAVQDLVGDHVIGHRVSRPSLCQRKLMTKGEGVHVAQCGYQSIIR